MFFQERERRAEVDVFIQRYFDIEDTILVDDDSDDNEKLLTQKQMEEEVNVKMEGLNCNNITGMWDYELPTGDDQLTKAVPPNDAGDLVFRPQCALKLDLFPHPSSLTPRESAYLEYNVVYLRMAQALTELTNRTGMPITQENGQRRFGPPLNYNGPAIERGAEVFVGKLPRDIFEDEIVPVFQKAGDIFELRLMMDFSGTNRGYCFVQYYSSESASKAIKLLNDYEIRPGRFLGVVKSVDNCRLFVGGIPRDKTREQIFEEIKKVTEGVIRVIANPSPMDHRKNRGYAFIEYENHRAAAMARRKLIPGKIQLWGVPVAVDWAEPEPDVTNLYVRNVSMGTTEDDLQKLFNAHSRNGVDKVKKIKDYAFVHFLSRNQAEEAMKALDTTELDGSRLEICWAKPVNKIVHNARKALGKHLYGSANGGSKYTKGGNFEGRNNSSDRIFGQYNSLSTMTNHHHIIYPQMATQPYHNNAGDYGNYSMTPYQTGSLLQHHHHESGQNGRSNGHFPQYYQSGQVIHPGNMPHAKGSLLGEPEPGHYNSGGHQATPGMFIPIAAGHSPYRAGPMYTQYVTPLNVGLPYIL